MLTVEHGQYGSGDKEPEPTKRSDGKDKQNKIKPLKSPGRLPPRQVVPVGVHEQQERMDVFSNLRSHSLESIDASPTLICYFSFWGGVLGLGCNIVGLMCLGVLLIGAINTFGKVVSASLMCMCFFTLLLDIPNVIHYTQMPKKWGCCLISFRIISIAHACIAASAILFTLLTHDRLYVASCANLCPGLMYYLALKRGENRSEPEAQELLV